MQFAERRARRFDERRWNFWVGEFSNERGRPPASLIERLTSASAVTSRPAAVTPQPSLPSRRAVARPIPLVAPVTIAVFMFLTLLPLPTNCPAGASVSQDDYSPAAAPPGRERPKAPKNDRWTSVRWREARQGFLPGGHSSMSRHSTATADVFAAGEIARAAGVPVRQVRESLLSGEVPLVAGTYVRVRDAVALVRRLRGEPTTAVRRELFARPRRPRAQPAPAWRGRASHAAIFGGLLLLAALGATATTNEPPPRIDPTRLVFLVRPGPGGGGGAAA